MAERANPTLCELEEISLTGSMAVYALQAEAAIRIPQQRQEFRSANTSLGRSARLYGSSPCTADYKIHYLSGVERDGAEGPISRGRISLLRRESMRSFECMIPIHFATHGYIYWEACCLYRGVRKSMRRSLSGKPACPKPKRRLDQ